MGKLRAYLSQVQDFIASPISRNVMLNDLYQEALELLFNDNKEPPKEAIVLKVFPQNQTTAELKEGEEQFQSAVIRIPGLHDCVPDPVRLIKNSTNGEVNNCIQIHGVCFSKDPLTSTESSTSPPEMVKVGDVVRIEYINGVPRFGEVIKKEREYAKLQFISEAPEDQDSIVKEEELQSKFQSNQVSSVEDFVGPPAPGQDSNIEVGIYVKTGEIVKNGNLTESVLSPVPGKKDRYGRDILVISEIADDLLALMNDFKSHFGFEMSVSSHYRTYKRQVATKKRWTKKGKPHYAATPGTSKHGWGFAIDIDTGYPTEIKKFKYTKYKGGTSGFEGDIYKWMFTNAPKRGFHSPPWAQPGGSPEEPWHFEWIKRDEIIKIQNKKIKNESE